jgi:NAD(P)-dependent dehydrogenase (short-subunit alcohol dehydrogenase family)
MKRWQLVVSCAALALLGSWWAAQGRAAASAATPAAAQDAAAPQRAVLVTGASSGIGRKTTELLAANGFFVYAGARKEEDLAALAQIANVQPIQLDVTKWEQIDAAVAVVRAGGRGLYGLINNAGVAVLGPLIELRESDLDFQLDANVYGPYRMTQAFAPFLIESKGRVATTGSISGFVTWPMGGAYTMSKHAVEAFTDTLAAELAPFGVAVSVVDPGNYKSEIMANMRQRLLDSGYTRKGSRYEKQIERLLDAPADRGQYKEPDEVAQAFLHALTAAEPKRRYLVVPNRGEAETTIKAALTRAVQLNAEQPYTLDRDALAKLLDEVLAAQ